MLAFFLAGMFGAPAWGEQLPGHFIATCKNVTRGIQVWVDDGDGLVGKVEVYVDDTGYVVPCNPPTIQPYPPSFCQVTADEVYIINKGPEGLIYECF